MDWIEKALEGIENVAEVAAKIRSELPKNYIPKEKFNDLAEAKRLVEEKLNSGMDDRVRDVAVKAALRSLTGELKVRDVDVVRMLIDKQAVSVGDDGSVVGLDEQIKGIMKEKPYLFSGEPLAGRTPFMGGGDIPIITKEQFGNMGYRERIRLFEEQPEVYRNLMG